MSDWRDMKTAPHGVPFMAWIDKYGLELECRINPDTEAFEIFGRVDYDQDGWEVVPHMTPTHWMPYPYPPK